MMKKNSLAPLVVAVALLLGACGSNPNSAVKFGPSPQTSPSGYFFTLTLSQTVLSATTTSPTIIATVHVYVGNGGSPGVAVPLYFGGDITAPSTIPTTDPATGLATVALVATSVTPGSTGVINVTVENQTVQGKFQVQD
jgi:hypothetical protein